MRQEVHLDVYSCPHHPRSLTQSQLLAIRLQAFFLFADSLVCCKIYKFLLKSLCSVVGYEGDIDVIQIEEANFSYSCVFLRVIKPMN